MLEKSTQVKVTSFEVAQLSQRDCSAGGLVKAKSGRLELGDNICADIIGLYSTTVTYLASKAIRFGENAK